MSGGTSVSRAAIAIGIAVTTWTGWISVALYVSYARQLPDAPAGDYFHHAGGDWCDVTPESQSAPLVRKHGIILNRRAELGDTA